MFDFSWDLPISEMSQSTNWQIIGETMNDSFNIDIN